MARPRRGFPHPLQYSAHMPFRVSIPLTAALAAAAMAAASMVAPALAAPSTTGAETARQHSVGGQVVPMGFFPWAVALEVNRAGQDAPAKFCSGALIAPTYVLTAAHCAQAEDLNSKEDVRRAGLAVRFGNLAGQPVVAARRITLPGGYWVYMYGRRQQSDIALVELVAPAPTAPQPLSSSVPGEGSPIAALGYGTTPERRVLSDELMQAWSLVSAPAKCGGMSQQGVAVKVFPQVEACSTAGPTDATPPLDGATCQGDSGGPWVTPDLSAIVGVTSWGRLNACRQPPALRSSVLARVGPVAGWLKRQTGAGLFGEAPVPVDRRAPTGARLSRGALGTDGLPVEVGARGTDWRATVFVMFNRDGDALPSSLTVALDLTPGSPRGVVRPPARWGPNPPGLEVGFVSARVWRPDNLNGVTLTTE